MGEIGLGQFFKNVFDYSTGKAPQQQPGKLANENFQKAQNEVVKMVNQTAQNIAQNFVRQQDVMYTQMQLKELTNFERSLLLKNLFDFPSDIKDLVQFLATDGKMLNAKDLKALMSQNIDLSKLLVLMQTNGKSALEKIQKMITTMNQSGIYDTRQLKEMTILVNACIPSSEAQSAQILKNLMIMYLPWLPINENISFNQGSNEENSKSASGEDVMTIIITTKNFGIVKILLFKEGSEYNMDVNCSESFPKDEFNEALKGENASSGINSNVIYNVRKSSQEEKAPEAKVEFSKSTKVSPSLLIIIHALIKLVMELDSKGVTA